MAIEEIRDAFHPLGPDEPRELERKLNNNYRELCAAAGVTFREIKMTVSSSDGRIDSPRLLELKLNLMNAEIAAAAGEPPPEPVYVTRVAAAPPSLLAGAPTTTPEPSRTIVPGRSLAVLKVVIRKLTTALGGTPVPTPPPSPTPAPVPTPTPAPSIAAPVLPALLEGTNGNHVCWPQAFVPRGTNHRMDGAVKMSGEQVVYRTDYSTGQLLRTYSIRSNTTRADDHNVPSGSEYPDGGQLWVAAGHGADSLVQVAYIAPDGNMVMRDPITCSGSTTYPGLYIDGTGRAWMHVRAGNLSWVLRYSDDRGVTWSNEIVYMTGSGSTLIYGYLRFSATHAYGWGRYNSAAVNFGKPKPFQLNLVTGEFTAGSVGLGYIDGRPSANGNTLPFSLDTVPSLIDPPAGYAYDVLEHTEDGKKAVLILVNTADIRDAQVEHWQVASVGDRYDSTKYSKAVLTNFAARLGYNGFDAYPNLCYDRNPDVSGTRLFLARKITVPKAEPVADAGVEDRWVFERWDNPSGNNTTWNTTRLLTGAEYYKSMSRPYGAYNASNVTPFSVSRMKFITEYNAITDAKVEFFDPAKGRQGFTEEAATAVWAAQAGFTPTALQRAVVNCGFRDLQISGLVPDVGQAVAMMKSVLAGVYPVSQNALVNNIYAGVAADWVAETGQQLPKVLRPLVLGYPALLKVGQAVNLTVAYNRAPSTVTLTMPSGRTADLSSGAATFTPQFSGKQLAAVLSETKDGVTRTTQVMLDVQPAPTAYFADSYTDPNGTSIYAHTSESGHTYVRRSHTNNGTVAVNNSGVTFSSASGMQLQINAPAKADVHFEAEIVARNTTASSPMLLVRCPDDNGDPDVVDDNGYCVYWSNTLLQFVLAVRTAGAVTPLIDVATGLPTVFADTWPSGVTKVVAITAHGNRISMTVDGVLRATAVDNTYAGPGRLNIRNSAAGSGTTFGRVITDARCYDLADNSAETTPRTLSLTGGGAKNEGQENTTTSYTFTATRTYTQGAVSVPWTFQAGTTSPDDFVGGAYPAGGTLEFADGEAAKQFTVEVRGDNSVEPDEQFTVAVTLPTGYTVGTGLTATGGVLNDDYAVVPSISMLSATRVAKSSVKAQQDPTFDPAVNIAQPVAEATPANSAITAPVLNPLILDPADLRQTFQGFGVQIQGASSYNLLNRLTPAQKADLLYQTFHPSQSNLTYGRIYFGDGAFIHQYITEGPLAGTNAADYYTMVGPLRDTTAQDSSLPGFSMDRFMLNTGNLLKDILAINPEFRIFASCASPPAWMKSGYNTESKLDDRGAPAPGTAGRLLSAYYTHYANYFVKSIQACAAQGIPIYGINMQNEPANPGAYPTAELSESQTITFLRDFLWPALVAANLHTTVKVFVGEVNYQSTRFYVTPLLSRADLQGMIQGVSYHGYHINDEYRTPYATYPQYEYFMNEFKTQADEPTDAGQVDLWKVFVQGTRAGIGALSLFVYALTVKGEPAMGRLNRRGVVTIKEDGSGWQKNPEYHMLNMWSVNVKRGARYAHSHSHDAAVNSVLAINPNGRRTLFATYTNTGGSVRNFNVVDAGTCRYFPASLTAGANLMYTYDSVVPTSRAGAVNALNATGSDTQVALSWALPADANRLGLVVFRRTAADAAAVPPVAPRPIVALPPGATGYTDTAVKTGTNYQYSYRAMGGGLGPASAEVAVTTTGATSLVLGDSTLAFSPALQAGVKSVGTFTGVNAASTVTYAAEGYTGTLPAGTTTFEVTPPVSQADQDITWSWTEENANASNSPKSNPTLVTRVLPAAVPTVTLAGPPATDEGNSGATAYTFTVTRSTSAGTAVVPWTFAAGTTSADDFVGGAYPTGGSVSFAAGETSKTFVVNVQGDLSQENDETFSVAITAPSGYANGASMQVSATVRNDDTPTPTVTIAGPAAKNEGDSGATNYDFVVARSTSAGAVNVAWTFGAGTTSADDFVGGAYPAGGTVAFAAGETSKTISIAVSGDTSVEPTETFTVSITAPSGYANGASMQATGTITNDDATPTVNIAGPPAKSEGNSGTSNWDFVVTRSTGTGTANVVWTFAAGTTSADDYAGAAYPQGGSLAFAAGETSKTISIGVNGDTAVEADESFTVAITAPGGYAAGTNMSATGTILNDDASAIPANVLLRDTMTSSTGSEQTLDLHTPEKGGGWVRKAAITSARTISIGTTGVTYSNADTTVGNVQYSNQTAMPSSGYRVDIQHKVRTQAGSISIVGCSVAGADQGYSLVYNPSSGAWTMQRRGSSNVTLGTVVTNKIAVGATVTLYVIYAANGDITWSIAGGTAQTVNDATYARTGTMDVRQGFLGSGIGGSTDTTGVGLDEITVTALA